MTGVTETEVKIPLPDAVAILDRLNQAGFTMSAPRQFESNTLYDSPDRKLRQASMIVRLRETGAKFVLTWKGPGEAGKYKSRPELETAVGSLDVLHKILGHLGFEPIFRYEKYRREFADHVADGVITLDETPIGDFLELEGPGDWIDKTAQRLGFSPKDYLLDSYGRLYEAYCDRRGIKLENMVFTR